MNGEKLKQVLLSLLAEKGARLIGAANLSGVINGELQTGISVAVPVPASIVKDLQTAPNDMEALYACRAWLLMRRCPSIRR